jgi:hypothetical protein
MQLFKPDDLCVYIPRVERPRVESKAAASTAPVFTFALVHDVVFEPKKMTGPIYLIWIAPGIAWIALHNELRPFEWAFRRLE